MSHTAEVEFLEQGRKVIRRKRNIGKDEYGKQAHRAEGCKNKVVLEERAGDGFL